MGLATDLNRIGKQLELSSTAVVARNKKNSGLSDLKIMSENGKFGIYKRRIFGLDVLRAMAVIFVIYGHGEALLKDYINVRLYDFFTLDGVAIFFVLSGFLIGGILLKMIETGRFRFADLVNFWTRRWFRTLPNYFLVLIALTLWHLFVFGSIPGNFYRYFVFVQNIGANSISFFGESWSLSVEEWFYLVVPFTFMLVLANRKLASRRAFVLVLILLVIVAENATRVYIAVAHASEDHEKWINIIHYGVLTRIDCIMYGFLGIYLKTYYNSIWYRYRKSLLVLGCCLLLAIQVWLAIGGGYFFGTCFKIPLVGIATFAILPVLSNLATGPRLVSRFFTQISILSYSLYLLNRTPVRKAILPPLLRLLQVNPASGLSPALVSYFLYLLLTFLLSYLLYHLYEKRMTDLRDHFSTK